MPLSNDAVTLVLRALKSLMADPGRCFTAYDVTKLTRSLGKDRIRHDDVRAVVHQLYTDGFLPGFNRLNHSFVNTENQQWVTAQLYVPPGGDANSYSPDAVAKTTVVAPSTINDSEDVVDSDYSCDEDDSSEEDNNLGSTLDDLLEDDEDKTDNATPIVVSASLSAPPPPGPIPTPPPQPILTLAPDKTFKPTGKSVDHPDYLRTWNQTFTPEPKSEEKDESLLGKLIEFGKKLPKLF